ncbi:hypothetical protein ACN47E_010312 [Coniothyrium glycines]
MASLAHGFQNSPMVYIIDPFADTIIYLKRPCSDFAPWDPAFDSDQEDPRSAESSLSDQDSCLGDSPILSTPQREEDAVAASKLVVCSGELDAEVQYHVSSRHLMMASSVFRSALSKDGFLESERCGAYNMFHIKTEGWDAEAFLLILNIFHLQNKLVPRVVTLEMLAKVAVLVDYYDCGEALELFTEMWIERIKQSILVPEYNRELRLWILVAWVFKLEDRLKSATRIAIEHSTGFFDTLGLPIPPRICDAINLQRCSAIESTLAFCEQLLSKYCSADYACPHGTGYTERCGSFLLGHLTRKLAALRMLKPRPELPFLNLSWHYVSRRLLYGASGWYASVKKYDGEHPCTVSDELSPFVRNVMATIEGFDIAAAEEA